MERRLRTIGAILTVTAGLASWTLFSRASERDAVTASSTIAGWRPGVGWGWIWGDEDEVGALNAMTEATTLASLKIVQRGQVYDLGITYSRRSFKWPGHSPGEVLTFRSPEGVARQGDHEKIAEHDSAGLTLPAAKHLVQNHGAMMIVTDTSGLEQAPAPSGSDTFIPCHKYLLVEQGVHIGEFHYLEDLARDQVYEFCYVATTNKIAGTTAGFTMRPIAIR